MMNNSRELKRLAMLPICALFFFIGAVTVQAATIYADNAASMGGNNCTSGNYSILNRNCTGTDGNAYKTWTECADAIRQGDKCYIRGGTYTTYLTASTASLTSGTSYANAPRVAPYPTETVIIKPQNATYNLYLNGVLDYFIFGECDANHTARLIFDGTGMTGSFAPVHLISSTNTHIRFSCIKITNTINTAAGMFVQDGSNNGIIEYSEFTANGNHDIYISSDGWLIEHNWFHATGGVENNAYNVHLNDSTPGGSCNKHIVQYNRMENVRNGVLLDGSNNLVYRNTIHHVTAFDGIMVGYSSNVSGLPNLIYHNITVDMARNGIRIGEFCGSPCTTVGTVVKNNIVLLAGGTTIEQYQGTGSVLAGNKTSGSTSDCFNNYAALDFTPKVGSTSTCIDAGVVIPGYSYVGASPDQGVYESGVDTSGPAAPLGLKIS